MGVFACNSGRHLLLAALRRSPTVLPACVLASPLFSSFSRLPAFAAVSMRLLTHNQLVCVRKGCANHYPLTLTATKVEKAGQGEDDEEMEEDDEEEAAAKLDFVLHLLPNVDYSVLLTAATAVGDAATQRRAAACEGRRAWQRAAQVEHACVQ